MLDSIGQYLCDYFIHKVTKCNSYIGPRIHITHFGDKNNVSTVDIFEHFSVVENIFDDKTIAFNMCLRMGAS